MVDNTFRFKDPDLLKQYIRDTLKELNYEDLIGIDFENFNYFSSFTTSENTNGTYGSVYLVVVTTTRFSNTALDFANSIELVGGNITLKNGHRPYFRNIWLNFSITDGSYLGNTIGSWDLRSNSRASLGFINNYPLNMKTPKDFKTYSDRSHTVNGFLVYLQQTSVSSTLNMQLVDYESLFTEEGYYTNILYSTLPFTHPDLGELLEPIPYDYVPITDEVILKIHPYSILGGDEETELRIMTPNGIKYIYFTENSPVRIMTPNGIKCLKVGSE